MTASTRRVLIPSAGFGKRAGSPPAKELLPDPVSGKPLIARSIELALGAGAVPLVITRRDKFALVEALRDFPGVESLLIDSSREWPHTLLQSAPLWLGTNVVLLPDTVFEPASAVSEMFEALEAGAEAAYATFEAHDLRAWGAVAPDGKGFQLCEKPDASPAGITPRAWGLFGWKKVAGAALLEATLQSSADHEWKKIAAVPAFLRLRSFEDLTRGA